MLLHRKQEIGHRNQETVVMTQELGIRIKMGEIMVRNVEDLIIWQRAMDLTVEIYVLMKRLPKEEVYSLQDQMKRASVSIPSNIAEGFGRNNLKEFRRFLLIARGSAMELETQLKICVKIGYLSEKDTEKPLGLLEEIRKMTFSLISSRN